jgi:hypothetical protein
MTGGTVGIGCGATSVTLDPEGRLSLHAVAPWARAHVVRPVAEGEVEQWPFASRCLGCGEGE